MKIYISLPISGREKKARERAEKIAVALKELGHIPVNPFDIYAGENPDYFDHICCDLRAMMDCDAVYFDKGYYNSCGCCIEGDVIWRLMQHDKKFIKKIYGDIDFNVFLEDENLPLLKKLKELGI